MTLREMKRSGGYVLPDARGAWTAYGPGQLARCPSPLCARGLGQSDAYSQTLVRLAPEGIGEPGQTSLFILCPDSRCPARIQMRILPASPNADRRDAGRGDGPALVRDAERR